MARVDIKKHFSFVFVSLIVGFIIVATLLFFAQKFSKTHRIPLPVAIINLQRLYEQATPFVAFRKEMEKKHSDAYGHVRKKETSLRTEYESIQKLKNISKKELAKKKSAFDKQVAELEAKVQKEREELSKVFSTLDGKLKGLVQEIVKELAADYQVKLIMNTQVGEHDLVVYAEQTLNLTDELISRVNEAIDFETIQREQ